MKRLQSPLPTLLVLVCSSTIACVIGAEETGPKVPVVIFVSVSSFIVCGPCSGAGLKRYSRHLCLLASSSIFVVSRRTVVRVSFPEVSLLDYVSISLDSRPLIYLTYSDSSFKVSTHFWTDLLARLELFSLFLPFPTSSHFFAQLLMYIKNRTKIISPLPDMPNSLFCVI